MIGVEGSLLATSTAGREPTRWMSSSMSVESRGPADTMPSPDRCDNASHYTRRTLIAVTVCRRDASVSDASAWSSALLSAVVGGSEAFPAVSQVPLPPAMLAFRLRRSAWDFCRAEGFALRLFKICMLKLTVRLTAGLFFIAGVLADKGNWMAR